MHEAEQRGTHTTAALVRDFNVVLMIRTHAAARADQLHVTVKGEIYALARDVKIYLNNVPRMVEYGPKTIKDTV